MIAMSMVARNCRLAQQGHLEQAAVAASDNVDAIRQIGMLGFLSAACHGLAVVQRMSGNRDETLRACEAALKCTETLGFTHFRCAVHCEAGLVSLISGETDEAESSFRRALEGARERGERFWELKAAAGLAQLWKDQGRRREAYELLEPIYGWFKEGLDTPPLVEARELLGEVSDG
jgi:ATP/maltotriose-dependent transcriptional regulator MalT